MDIGTYFFDPEVKLIYSIGKGNSEILVCSTIEDGSAVRSKEDPQTACGEKFFDNLNNFVLNLFLNSSLSMETN